MDIYRELMTKLDKYNGCAIPLKDILRLVNDFKADYGFDCKIVIVFGEITSDFVGDPHGMCGYINDFYPEEDEVAEDDLTSGQLESECEIYNFDYEEDVMTINVERL